MKADDPTLGDVLRRSMVARIATLSRNGRPSITPLYFVCVNGQIWLGTVDWTLAARDVKADPRVSVLFEVGQNPHDHRIVRITGRANLRTDRKAQRSYVLRVAFKYSLTPGQIRNSLAHIGQLLLRRHYHAQSAEKGQSCVIVVTPEQAEFLNDNQSG
ncbi:MAG TPA: pyridoxamine 5'-phosphate oxidase family protein [Roseiflexaceae bacterium]